MTYEATRERLETYFDKTAARTWEALTSDAPVSRIRQTVRQGRDQMRSELLSILPRDLRGARILDAGCGAGQLTIELAERGASVVGVDISPSLLDIAYRRTPEHLLARIEYIAGDMLDPAFGTFDAAVAMDSLIHYDAGDIARAVGGLAARLSSGPLAFTVAPRTSLLVAMWWAGKAFPRGDKSPAIIPHRASTIQRELRKAGFSTALVERERVASGFYISQALEARA